MQKQNVLRWKGSPVVSKHVACFSVYMSKLIRSDISAKNRIVLQMWNPARSTRKAASTQNTPIHGWRIGRGRLCQHFGKYH